MICLPPQNQLCACWWRILLSSDVYKDLVRFNFVLICLSKCKQDSRDANLSRDRHICAKDDCQEPVLPCAIMASGVEAPVGGTGVYSAITCNLLFRDRITRKSLSLLNCEMTNQNIGCFTSKEEYNLTFQIESL